MSISRQDAMVYWWQANSHKRFNFDAWAANESRKDEWKWRASPHMRLRTELSKRFREVAGNMWESQRNWNRVRQIYCEFNRASFLTDVYGDDHHQIFLRSMYVFPEDRGKGVLHSFLKDLTEISTKTGCSIVTVSNPFTLSPARIEDRAETFVEGKGFDYVADFRPQQEWMNNRLIALNFQKIRFPDHNLGDKARTGNSCFIYLPTTADTEFAKRIESRLVKE